MKKEIYTVEYPMNNASSGVLWKVIGTPLGLAEWFADGVTVNDTEYTFSWENNDMTAILLQTKPGKLIRFQWEEDAGSDTYFQIEINMQDLTGNVALIVTDFAEPEDKEDAILLWNNQIETMKRKNGI
ncbi:MAG: START-like domain-containing protein [Paludibacteraceae bacterium]